MNIQIPHMASAANQATELLKALSNRHRLMIVCLLSDGECSVTELAALLGIRPSSASQHLALMRKDGIVAARREGQTIYYRIGSAPARALVETLYRSFCAPAHAANLCTDNGREDRDA